MAKKQTAPTFYPKPIEFEGDDLYNSGALDYVAQDSSNMFGQDAYQQAKKQAEEDGILPRGGDTKGNGFLGHMIDAAQAGAYYSIGGTARFGAEFSPFGGEMLNGVADWMENRAQYNTPEKELKGTDWVASQIGNAIGSGGAAMAEAAIIYGIGSALGAGVATTGLGATTIKAIQASRAYTSLANTAGRMWASPFGKMVLGEVAGTPFEATAEAGNLISELRSEGVSDDEIRTAALKSAGYNMAFLTVSNLLEAKVGMKVAGLGAKTVASAGEAADVLGATAKKSWKDAGKRALKGSALGAVTEGGEEYGQSWIEDTAANKPFDEQKAWEGFLGGAVGGGVLKGAGVGYNTKFGPDNRQFEYNGREYEATAPDRAGNRQFTIDGKPVRAAEFYALGEQDAKNQIQNGGERFGYDKETAQYNKDRALILDEQQKYEEGDEEYNMLRDAYNNQDFKEVRKVASEIGARREEEESKIKEVQNTGKPSKEDINSATKALRSELPNQFLSKIGTDGYTAEQARSEYSAVADEMLNRGLVSPDNHRYFKGIFEHRLKYPTLVATSHKQALEKASQRGEDIIRDFYENGGDFHQTYKNYNKDVNELIQYSQSGNNYLTKNEGNKLKNDFRKRLTMLNDLREDGVSYPDAMKQVDSALANPEQTVKSGKPIKGDNVAQGATTANANKVGKPPIREENGHKYISDNYPTNEQGFKQTDNHTQLGYVKSDLLNDFKNGKVTEEELRKQWEGAKASTKDSQEGIAQLDKNFEKTVKNIKKEKEAELDKQNRGHKSDGLEINDKGVKIANNIKDLNDIRSDIYARYEDNEEGLTPYKALKEVSEAIKDSVNRGVVEPNEALEVYNKLNSDIEKLNKLRKDGKVQTPASKPKQQPQPKGPEKTDKGGTKVEDSKTGKDNTSKTKTDEEKLADDRKRTITGLKNILSAPNIKEEDKNEIQAAIDSNDDIKLYEVAVKFNVKTYQNNGLKHNYNSKINSLIYNVLSENVSKGLRGEMEEAEIQSFFTQFEQLMSSNTILTDSSKDTYLKEIARQKKLFQEGKKYKETFDALFKKAGVKVNYDFNRIQELAKLTYGDKVHVVNGKIQIGDNQNDIFRGCYYDGTVYLDLGSITPNSAMHEYTHAWNAIIRENFPELWNKGKDLFRDTAEWKKVVANPNYKHIADNEDEIFDEVLAHLSGKENKDELAKLIGESKDSNIVSKIKEWLDKYWNTLKDTFSDWTGKEIGSLTQKQFKNMPIRDLVNGVKLNEQNKVKVDGNVEENTSEKAVKTNAADKNTSNNSKKGKKQKEIVKAPDGMPQELDGCQFSSWRESQFKGQEGKYYGVYKDGNKAITVTTDKDKKPLAIKINPNVKDKKESKKIASIPVATWDDVNSKINGTNNSATQIDINNVPISPPNNIPSVEEFVFGDNQDDKNDNDLHSSNDGSIPVKEAAANSRKSLAAKFKKKSTKKGFDKDFMEKSLNIAKPKAMVGEDTEELKINVNAFTATFGVGAYYSSTENLGLGSPEWKNAITKEFKKAGLSGAEEYFNPVEAALKEFEKYDVEADFETLVDCFAIAAEDISNGLTVEQSIKNFYKEYEDAPKGFIESALAGAKVWNDERNNEKLSEKDADAQKLEKIIDEVDEELEDDDSENEYDYEEEENAEEEMEEAPDEEEDVDAEEAGEKLKYVEKPLLNESSERYKKLHNPEKYDYFPYGNKDTRPINTNYGSRVSGTQWTVASVFNLKRIEGDAENGGKALEYLTSSQFDNLKAIEDGLEVLKEQGFNGQLAIVKNKETGNYEVLKMISDGRFGPKKVYENKEEGIKNLSHSTTRTVRKYFKNNPKAGKVALSISHSSDIHVFARRSDNPNTKTQYIVYWADDNGHPYKFYSKKMLTALEYVYLYVNKEPMVVEDYYNSIDEEGKMVEDFIDNYTSKGNTHAARALRGKQKVLDDIKKMLKDTKSRVFKHIVIEADSKNKTNEVADYYILHDGLQEPEKVSRYFVEALSYIGEKDGRGWNVEDRYVDVDSIGPEELDNMVNDGIIDQDTADTLTDFKELKIGSKAYPLELHVRDSAFADMQYDTTEKLDHKESYDALKKELSNKAVGAVNGVGQGSYWGKYGKAITEYYKVYKMFGGMAKLSNLVRSGYISKEVADIVRDNKYQGKSLESIVRAIAKKDLEFYSNAMMNSSSGLEDLYQRIMALDDGAKVWQNLQPSIQKYYKELVNKYKFYVRKLYGWKREDIDVPDLSTVDAQEIKELRLENAKKKTFKALQEKTINEAMRAAMNRLSIIKDTRDRLSPDEAAAVVVRLMSDGKLEKISDDASLRAYYEGFKSDSKYLIKELNKIADARERELNKTKTVANNEESNATKEKRAQLGKFKMAMAPANLAKTVSYIHNVMLAKQGEVKLDYQSVSRAIDGYLKAKNDEVNHAKLAIDSIFKRASSAPMLEKINALVDVYLTANATNQGSVGVQRVLREIHNTEDIDADGIRSYAKRLGYDTNMAQNLREGKITPETEFLYNNEGKATMADKVEEFGEAHRRANAGKPIVDGNTGNFVGTTVLIKINAEDGVINLMPQAIYEKGSKKINKKGEVERARLSSDEKAKLYAMGFALRKVQDTWVYTASIKYKPAMQYVKYLGVANDGGTHPVRLEKSNYDPAFYGPAAIPHKYRIYKTTNDKGAGYWNIEIDFSSGKAKKSSDALYSALVSMGMKQSVKEYGNKEIWTRRTGSMPFADLMELYGYDETEGWQKPFISKGKELFNEYLSKKSAGLDDSAADIIEAAEAINYYNQQLSDEEKAAAHSEALSLLDNLRKIKAEQKKTGSDYIKKAIVALIHQLKPDAKKFVKELRDLSNAVNKKQNEYVSDFIKKYPFAKSTVEEIKGGLQLTDDVLAEKSIKMSEDYISNFIKKYKEKHNIHLSDAALQMALDILGVDSREAYTIDGKPVNVEISPKSKPQTYSTKFGKMIIKDGVLYPAEKSKFNAETATKGNWETYLRSAYHLYKTYNGDILRMIADAEANMDKLTPKQQEQWKNVVEFLRSFVGEDKKPIPKDVSKFASKKTNSQIIREVGGQTPEQIKVMKKPVAIKVADGEFHIDEYGKPTGKDVNSESKLQKVQKDAIDLLVRHHFNFNSAMGAIKDLKTEASKSVYNKLKVWNSTSRAYEIAKQMEELADGTRKTPIELLKSKKTELTKAEDYESTLKKAELILQGKKPKPSFELMDENGKNVDIERYETKYFNTGKTEAQAEEEWLRNHPENIEENAEEETKSQEPKEYLVDTNRGRYKVTKTGSVQFVDEKAKQYMSNPFIAKAVRAFIKSNFNAEEAKNAIKDSKRLDGRFEGRAAALKLIDAWAKDERKFKLVDIQAELSAKAKADAERAEIEEADRERAKAEAEERKKDARERGEKARLARLAREKAEAEERKKGTPKPYVGTADDFFGEGPSLSNPLVDSVIYNESKKFIDNFADEQGLNINKAKDWFKAKLKQLYIDWVDKNYAFKAIDEILGMQKGGLYDRVTALVGTVSGMNTALVEGDENYINALNLSLEMNGELKLSGDTVAKAMNCIADNELSPSAKQFVTEYGNGSAVKALGNYLVARRLIELDNLAIKEGQTYIMPKTKDGRQVKRSDCEEVIKAATSEFKEAAKIYYGVNSNLMKLMLRSGLISKDLYNLLSTRYKNYCPLMRDFSDTAVEEEFFSSLGAGGKGIMNVTSPLRRLKKEGSSLDIVDPLTSTIQAIGTISNRCERNIVGRMAIEANAKIREAKGVPLFTEYKEADNKGELKYVKADPKKLVFTVMKNGERISYQLAKEHKDMYIPLVGYNPQAAGIMFKTARFTAECLRTGSTISPSFILRNFIRDTIFASVSSKHNFKPVATSLRGLEILFSENEYEKNLLAKYRSLGVGSYNFYKDMDSAIKSIEELNGGKPIKSLSPLDIFSTVKYQLEKYSGLIETSTRLGEFENAYNDYIADGETEANALHAAALDAMGLTLNFSRSGTLGQQVNQYIPFFNACIQGGDKMIELLRENPYGTMEKIVQFIVMPSVILWAMNHDEPWYKELDQGIKYSCWCLPGGIRIPKPQEAGVTFGSGIEALLDQMVDNDPIAMKSWIKEVRSVMAPNIMPTVMLPLIEWQTNYSFFRDGDLVSKRLQRLPDEMQYDDNTTNVAKLIGGATKTSPKKIDNLWRGYTGTMGSFLMQTGDWFDEDKLNQPAKRLSEMQFFRDFNVTPAIRGRYINDFYEMYNASEKQHAGYGKKNSPTAETKEIRKAFTKISSLSAEIREIRASKAPNIDSEKKRQLIEIRRNKINQIAKSVIDKYGENYL